MELLGPDGERVAPLSRRPRKLALLTVLALAPRPMARDALAEMFWGGKAQRRARHSLSDALSEIRRVLGPGSVETRGDTVALAATAPLEVDALLFEACCGVEDWARATALYGGSFLDCVFIGDAPSFETWSSGHAARLERMFAAACEAQLERLGKAGRWEASAALASRWLAAQPLAPEPALRLLAALRAPATPAAERAALDAHDRLAARLLREYDRAPDPRVLAVAAEVRRALAAPPEAPPAAFPLSAPAPASAAAAPAPSTGDGGASRRGRRRAGGAPRRWLGAIGLVGLLSLGVTGWELARPGHGPAAPARPLVAVLDIRDLLGDTAASWVGEGLTQMIASDLSRSPAIEVVAPERVRRAGESVAGVDGTGLRESPSARVGRALGASWVLTGGLTRGDTTYVLDVDLHEVETGRSLGLFTVTGRTLPALADRASARVIAAADGREPGPHLADVETGSLEAYQHFVRAEQALGEGREVEARAELDRAIALDSGFVSALAERMRIAWGEADGLTLGRLSGAFGRARGRATTWDRLELDTYAAVHGGDPWRGEARARELLARYPHDPRAYVILAGVLQDLGDWWAADSVLHRELALDSTGARGSGRACAPCSAFGGLATDAIQEGRLSAAERAARSWVTARPYLPAAWSALASTLAAEGAFDRALEAARRARTLAPADPVYGDHLVRVLLAARRYTAADTAIARMSRATDRQTRDDAIDLRALLERERGQLRASVRTLEAGRREDPRGLGILGFEEASSLAELGEYAAAVRVDETLTRGEPGSAAPDSSVTPVSGLVGGRARAFCWSHALEAEALAGSDDTLRLHALADSIGQAASRSYYGRDRVLSYHVLGLIAEIGGRLAEAERDFRRAKWGYAGWTSTLVHLARVQLQLHDPDDAVETLREAYAAPLDAMGRYVPRSELDLWMAQAFRAAARPDSAAVYRGYVARAWRQADPEVRARLAR